MKVLALLSFYDEPLEMLGELVDSLASVGVWGIVAVDGAYMEYPDAEATTGTDQGAVIAGTAGEHGMFSHVCIPEGPWEGGELEKRTFLFALGHEFVEVGEDWLWVVDADEVVSGDGDQLHATLAGTDLHVGKVAIEEDRHGRGWMMRMLFRSQPTGIEVTRYHAHYVTGDRRRTLWASCHVNHESKAVDIPEVTVLHRPLDRPKDRNQRRRQYYERAVLLGLDEAVI